MLDVLTLYRRGLKQRAIARKLGISRNTVKKYIDKPELAFKPAQKRKRRSQLDPYQDNIKAWIEEDSDYRASWIYDQLSNMGFAGSYEIVKRRVRQIKEDYQKVAYMRFETEPGYQAQAEFDEFQVAKADGAGAKLFLFSMILGYSRKMYAELIEHCDLPSFLDCHIRAFEYFGGVPQQILYDRMKNVYIGKIVGKNRFNDTLVGFALHYGFKPEVAPTYAGWIKGNGKRPYHFIREGFWRGYGFIYLNTANKDLLAWLAKKEHRVHGTTHEEVKDRFDREKPHLNSSPPQAFDTSYRIFRKVYKDFTVRFEGNSYLVASTLVGKQVILRVKDTTMRILHNDRLIVTYEIPEGKGHLVQDKRFYDALRKDRQMNKRKYKSGPRIKGQVKYMNNLS